MDILWELAGVIGFTWCEGRVHQAVEYEYAAKGLHEAAP